MAKNKQDKQNRKDIDTLLVTIIKTLKAARREKPKKSAKNFMKATVMLEDLSDRGIVPMIPAETRELLASLRSYLESGEIPAPKRTKRAA